MASSNTDDTRPTKRARESTTSDIADPTKCKRSERYWFEDGNIVLRVGDLLFRVYHGMLSHHSSVFRDMFVIPQPVTSEDGMVIDGCTVVVLSGDEPEDWETLLRVLYDHDTSYKSEGSLESKTLLSMLRLGRKYQFDVFFSAAMERIASLFPSTTDTWTTFCDELNSNDPVLIDILCLMVEIGNQTLLPTLYFYCASSFDLDEIFQTCVLDAKNDGSRLKVFQNILGGAESLREIFRKQQLTWISLHADREHRKNCSNYPSLTCHRTALKMNDRQPSDYMYLMLESAEDLMENIKNDDDKLCSACEKAITSSHEENQASVWEKLPSYFGLPAWADLKDL